jgi:hypothetical protein
MKTAKANSFIRAEVYINLVRKKKGDWQRVQKALKREGIKGTIDKDGQKDIW